MTVSALRIASVRRLVLFCAGILILGSGVISAVLCAYPPEPRYVSITVWDGGAPLVVTRNADFDASHATTPVLHVSMSEFRAQAAHQPYIVSYRQEWLTGSPWFYIYNSDAWRIFYVMKDSATGVTFVAYQDIPWHNRIGWHTDTFFDNKAMTFTERATGRSNRMFTAGILIALVGFGLMMWAIRTQQKQ